MVVVSSLFVVHCIALVKIRLLSFSKEFSFANPSGGRSSSERAQRDTNSLVQHVKRYRHLGFLVSTYTSPDKVFIFYPLYQVFKFMTFYIIIEHC